jgi:glycine/D-amino acid oxidase-like deaminating enzyme
MAPQVDPVRSDAALPARADVVVVGGGIVGVSTALFLAEKGISVALCEKGRIAGEQSGRNWGWVRKMGRDPAEIPLSVESLRLWEGMNERVAGETGFRRTGITYLCDTPRDLEQYEEWQEHARLYQLDSRLLGAEEIARLVPGAARRFAGGIHTPSDGRAEPTRAAPAIAEGARRQGAAILTSCAVRGVETAAGRVAAVVTEKGRIRCDAVVLAGGAWSRLFCGNFGFDLPLLKVLGSVMRTEPMEGPSEGAVGGSDFAFRKRLDGGYTVARRNADIAPIVPDSFRLFFDYLPALKTNWRSLRLRVNGRLVREWQVPRRWALDAASPFEQVRVLDPEPNKALLDEGHDNLVQAFPAFREMRMAESWAGLIDVTPDAVPVLSAVESLPGFFLATGLSGHGFGLGPGAGRLVADLVSGSTPIVDPTPFRFDRFARARAFRPERAAALEAAR